MAPRRRGTLGVLGFVLALTPGLVGCAPDGPTLSAETPPPSSSTTTVAATPTTASATEATAATAERAVVASALGASVTALVEPDEGAAVVGEFANPIPSGAPLVFQAVSADVTLDDEWIEVHLPMRPNGSTGWVRGDAVALSATPYRLVIDTSDHRLDVFRDGALELSTTIGVGTGATPTPLGRFYLAELLQPPDPGGAYGPFAFGLSGYSEVLESFNGGDGIVGIHGTNEPQLLGTDVSHGCVRVDNDVIIRLAETVPVGTPVDITA